MVCDQFGFACAQSHFNGGIVERGGDLHFNSSGRDVLFGAKLVKGQSAAEIKLDFFSPAVFRLAKAVGISEEAVSDSYIKLINQLNSQANVHYKPEEVLILVPHCLQKADCPYKITVDVHNCHRCGRCSINGLLAISEERGVKLAVASGGTFARKAIKDQKPKAVVAIACYRDLFSGMRDMKKVPIIGVLNERPNGPCYNTTVQLCRVNQALDCFLQKAEDSV